MEEIIALVDYKGHFGSKHNAVPYRSGMDKNLLEKYFAQFGFEIIFKNFSDVDFKNENYKGQYILYTSSEDKGYNYKNYIEDIIWGLKEQEAILIPDFKYLRANNNKVLMEILRNNSPLNEIKNIQSFHYGTLEELIHHIKRNTYPCVIKTAKGAKSTGVHLAKNKYELINFVKEISRTPHFFYEIKDYLRQYKHKGYKTESKYQRKFVVQEYIPNLKNDWKILIFGKKYYILKRKNRKNDFRASGSGLFSFTKEIPFRMLDFAEKISTVLNVPNINLDIAIDGNQTYLIEFQAIYFGTYTLSFSEFFFTKNNNDWQCIESKSILEKEFAESITEFIERSVK